MTYRVFQNRCAQKGFALLELTLALVLAAIFFVSMAPMVVRSQDAGLAKAVALDHTAFKTAVSAHFLSNKAAYVAAMTDGTAANQLCKLGVAADGSGGVVAANTTQHRCAIDTSMLRFLKVLPQTVRPVNRYGETWVAIFKLVYTTPIAPAVPAPTGGVEMYIVSARVDGTAPLMPANPRTYDEASTAAGFAGGQAGVVPEADRSVCVASRATARYEACGPGWKANLADFLEPNELTLFASRLSN